jgi:hypothetical protein
MHLLHEVARQEKDGDAAVGERVILVVVPSFFFDEPLMMLRQLVIASNRFVGDRVQVFERMMMELMSLGLRLRATLLVARDLGQADP